MIFTFLLISAVFCIPQNIKNWINKDDEEGDLWAVVIAGANSYQNYWSQAQSCAAYQTLHQAGIPDERIIHWLYDDVAGSPSNPHPGELYLWMDGPEVYHDIPKDLTGSAITPEKMQDLLLGKPISGGSGKQLKTGPNDRIFFYYSDHGGDGIIYFPGFAEWHVKDFIATLESMHTNNLYKEMVIYLDTCHSGSMFNGVLDPSWNIYAATSADPIHVAWLCDCFTKITPGGCMSNCWAKYWIQDTTYAMGNGTMDKRTLYEQYATVREQTLHPCPERPTDVQTACNYGDFSISNQTLSVFQGPGKGKGNVAGKRDYFEGSGQSVMMNEAKLRGLEFQYARTNSLTAKRELEDYREMVRKVDLVWSSFAEYFSLEIDEPNTDYYDCYPKDQVIIPDCQKEAVIAAKAACGSFNEYSLIYTKYLTKACHAGIDTQDIEEVLGRICSIVNSSTGK